MGAPLDFENVGNVAAIAGVAVSAAGVVYARLQLREARLQREAAETERQRTAMIAIGGGSLPTSYVGSQAMEQRIGDVGLEVESALVLADGSKHWAYLGVSRTEPRVSYDETPGGPYLGSLNDKRPNGAAYDVNEIQLCVDEVQPGKTFLFKGRRCYFSHADRARKAQSRGDLPQILSGNALVVAPERKRIILQGRGPESDRGGLKHFNGGAFLPLTYAFARHDLNSIAHTVMREVLEEVGAPILIRDEWSPIICKELDTGYIQVNYLGAPLAAEVADYIAEPKHFKHEEGTVSDHSLDDLIALMMDEARKYHTSATNGWIETGYAAALMWLGMGAPVLGMEETVFDGQRALAAYADLISILRKKGR